jgi:MazG family protein
LSETRESGIARLLAIMARLRDPERGCPWDLEQSFASIAKHTLEEAYEVDDAIRSGDMAGLQDELGDLLLQVAFHARMAEEAGHFDFDGVAHAISDKLVRRHPGIFSDAEIATAEQQVASWEAIKAQERAAKHESAGAANAKFAALEEVPIALPALTRAAKLLRRAEREGLGDLAPRVDVRVNEAHAQPAGAGEPLDERALGDALLALVARAQRAGLDAEEALRAANARLLERARERVR